MMRGEEEGKEEERKIGSSGGATPGRPRSTAAVVILSKQTVFFLFFYEVDHLQPSLSLLQTIFCLENSLTRKWPGSFTALAPPLVERNGGRQGEGMREWGREKGWTQQI